MGMAPAREQGVDIAFDTTSDGAVVRFTVTPEATPDRIASLRKRIRGWATRHQRFEPGGDQGGEPITAGGDECTNGGPAMPSSRVVAQDIPSGAELRFTASDRRQTTAVRDAVKNYAARVETGECRLIGQP